MQNRKSDFGLQPQLLKNPQPLSILQKEKSVLQKTTFKCPGCGAQFKTYNELIDHVVKAHDATCQICGAKTKSKEELLEHNKEKHGL